MPTYTCPDGHSSQSGDYCDVCGLPIQGASAGPSASSVAGSSAGYSAGASPLPPPLPAPASGSASPGGGPLAPAPAASSLSLDAPAPAVATRTCPNCSTDNPADALFCENCGYDFTTGQLPRPLPPPDAADAQPVPPPVPGTGSPDDVSWVAEVWVDPDWYNAQGVTDPLPSAGAPVVVPLAERTVLIGRTSASRNIHPQIDVSADNGVSRRHAQLSTDGQRWWIEDLQSSNGTFIGAAGEPLPTDPIPAGQRVELEDDDRVYVGAWTRIVVRQG
jgi:FHA domain